MTWAEIEDRADYFHQGAAMPTKTPVQALETAFEAVDASAQCAKEWAPAGRSERRHALLSMRAFPLDPQIVDRTDLQAHITVLRFLVSRAQRLAELSRRNHWCYSLPEHRAALQLISLEHVLIDEARIAEGN
jgi:hypothetical protein